MVCRLSSHTIVEHSNTELTTAYAHTCRGMHEKYRSDLDGKAFEPFRPLSPSEHISGLHQRMERMHTLMLQGRSPRTETCLAAVPVPDPTTAEEETADHAENFQEVLSMARLDLSGGMGHLPYHLTCKSEKELRLIAA